MFSNVDNDQRESESRMSLWEAEVVQYDCPHIRSTRKFPSLRIIIMGTEVEGTYERLFSIFSCKTAKELREVLSFFQRDKSVKNFKLVSNESGVAIAYYLILKTSMFKKTSKIGLRIHPVIAEAGRERWYLVSGQSKENIRTFLKDEFTKMLYIKKKRPAEIFRSFYTVVRYLMPALSISDKFSEREVDLLREAQERGFFSWPRRTTLTSLSKELRVPKSTLSYNFRAMEKKMVDALILTP